MSKKYSKNFIDYMEEFNELGSLNYISREFLGLMRQKCDRCNKSRVECAFQPHCKNRKYMNVLIDMKVNPNDIPSFCYSQQLRNIRDYLTGKAYLIEPLDYKIYLSDFNDLLDIKVKLGTKNFKKYYEELTQALSNLKGKIHSIQRIEDNKQYIMVIAEDVIYYIDLNKEIATINIQDKIVETEIELSDIIDLFSQNYKIKVEISIEMTGWWYLKASIPSKKLKNDIILEECKENIQEFSEYVNFYSNGEVIYFLIDIKTPLSEKWKSLRLSVSNLQNIFKLLDDLSKKIS